LTTEGRATPSLSLRIARHAATIGVGQVAVIGYAVADTVMTGRHNSAGTWRPCPSARRSTSASTSR